MTQKRRKWIMWIALTLVTSFSIHGINPSGLDSPDFKKITSFPGAEGFGCYTTGGRGGKVFIVDNLTDSENNPATGSFRWAVNQKGPRTIVFAVSGNIPLEAPLSVKNGDLTIAGQTAPGDGICIKNFCVTLKANNIIVRFLRFRCGNEKLTSDAQDALNGTKLENIIIDHCSMSWSIDETSSFYDNKNFTMQWCIISESLYKAGHHKGNHGFGGIWGGMGASFHHNLLASHTSRTPRFNGSRFTSDSISEMVDFRNNVIFNWGFQSAYGGEEGKQNMVNNYYKPGPATNSGQVLYRILDLTQMFYIESINPDTLYAGKFYIDGNVVEGFDNATNDNWGVGVQKATSLEKLSSKVTKPFPFAPVTTHSANDAYQLVLKKAGVNFPARDRVDSRIVSEVQSGKCSFGGSFGENSGIIDSQETVGGWPELESGSIPLDSDKDGMPDHWEVKHNLNPNDPADGIIISSKSGYTNLEQYINSLVENSVENQNEPFI